MGGAPLNVTSGGNKGGHPGINKPGEGGLHHSGGILGRDLVRIVRLTDSSTHPEGWRALTGSRPRGGLVEDFNIHP